MFKPNMGMLRMKRLNRSWNQSVKIKKEYVEICYTVIIIYFSTKKIYFIYTNLDIAYNCFAFLELNNQFKYIVISSY